MMKNLLETLKSCDSQPILMDGRLLVLPNGGRVLGLAPDRQTNVLWVNSAFESVPAAKALLNKPDWANLGGDRTWISPEIDTHVTDLSSMLESYRVPKSVDPGAYAVRHHDERSLTLESAMSVYFRRGDEHVNLTVSKTIELLEAPPLELRHGIDFAGYRQISTLTGAPVGGVRPGLWQLLQLPGGGRFELLVRKGARPRTFFGKPVYDLQGDRLRCRVDTDVSFKFSLVAGDCRGLMFYLNDSGPREILVARHFAVREAQHYADVSCAAPDDLGHVQQVYVDDGQLGGFGELEYHSPSIDSSGAGSVEDTSEVWAFMGTNLDEIAEQIVRSMG